MLTTHQDFALDKPTTNFARISWSPCGVQPPPYRKTCRDPSRCLPLLLTFIFLIPSSRLKIPKHLGPQIFGAWVILFCAGCLESGLSKTVTIRTASSANPLVQGWQQSICNREIDFVAWCIHPRRLASPGKVVSVVFGFDNRAIKLLDCRYVSGWNFVGQLTEYWKHSQVWQSKREIKIRIEEYPSSFKFCGGGVRISENTRYEQTTWRISQNSTGNIRNFDLRRCTCHFGYTAMTSRMVLKLSAAWSMVFFLPIIDRWKKSISVKDTACIFYSLISFQDRHSRLWSPVDTVTTNCFPLNIPGSPPWKIP